MMSGDQVSYVDHEGIPLKELSDQYADGKAARAFHLFVNARRRSHNYKDTLTGILRKHNCKTILDAACGTGIDSLMLIDEGFKVVSVDASDKMLKYAFEARWDKRIDPNYDEWIIEEANWETLLDDLERFLPDTQFDAIICLGNSFAHLLDEYGDQRIQKMCLRNFAKCLKPGGLLFIDHRNYDAMLNGTPAPARSVYYECKYPVDIKTSVLVVGGRAQLIALDYCITTDKESNETSEFRLCYYPHKLKKFTMMLDEAFDNRATHHIYADFKPLDQVPMPGFYIHVLEKAKN